jgi:prepilin-type N-terminal cleavage/methylation domain-containing protein
MQSPRSQRPAPNFQMLRAAFTILELVVVLMILSITAAAAVPTFYRSLEQNRVESAARRVKQDLEQLRQTARTLSKTETLTFTSSTVYTLSTDIGGLDRKGSYAVDLTKSPYSVRVLSTANLGNPATVSFDGYGTTTSSGSISMQIGAYQRTVTLDPSTGQATITGN